MSSLTTLTTALKEALTGGPDSTRVIFAFFIILLTRSLVRILFGASASRGGRRTTAEEDEEETFPEPMPTGDLRRTELKKYDGSDETKPILLAAKGIIFDVTRGRDFYGKGGPYNAFTGIDCSRALGKVSLEKEDLCGNVKDFAASQRDVLNDWVRKFEAKYPVVGKLIDGDYNGKF
jgi:membrane-associated progesterone receptor component